MSGAGTQVSVFQLSDGIPIERNFHRLFFSRQGARSIPKPTEPFPFREGKGRRGLVGPVRELDERLGLGELIDEHLSDSRQGTNKQFTLADLLRQSVYSRLAGYEDLNDAERVSIDPTFRLIGSQKIWDRGAALTSTLHGFETEMLASEENLLGLMALNRELVGQAEAFDDSERVVLDMDSTESPVHGQQEGSAYNGHFESVCYQPLLFVQRAW